MQLRKAFSFIIAYFLFFILLSSCSPAKQVSQTVQPELLSDSNLLNAHVGISIYDPSSNQYLYTHQAEKYFIPASNTKLFTCYAAMKHLGDSLVGMRYNINDSILSIWPTGDPTLLHSDFLKHPVLDFFKKYKDKPCLWLTNFGWQEERLGNGWAWNDYEENYMVERSPFPMYGNVVTVALRPLSERIHIRGRFTKGDKDSTAKLFDVIPSYFDKAINEIEHTADLYGDSAPRVRLRRSWDKNNFSSSSSNNLLPIKSQIPFSTSEWWRLPIELLSDTIKSTWNLNCKNVTGHFEYNAWKSIYSQPVDTVLRNMMHRSDNFFAEQLLLMVSSEKSKFNSVVRQAWIISELLRTDLKDLPQKPRWVDGSGLSRYNLFSPNDMVAVLNKMKNEFEWNRITTILPTGGEGTLSNYYISLKDKIFAKTGTLSNNIALSGFLITKQNKTLIFSVLVNNHMGNTTQIRRSVEKFLTGIADKY